MKSQIGMDVFKYLFAAIIIGVVILFGYFAMSNIGKAKCGADMSIYESSLKSFAENRDLGERANFNAAMPCKATYAFAIDVKKRDQVKESFYDIPYLKNQNYINQQNFTYLARIMCTSRGDPF